MLEADDRPVLARLGACDEGLAFLRRSGHAEVAWRTCLRPDWMLWIWGRLSGAPGDGREALVRACADCAERSGSVFPDLLAATRGWAEDRSWSPAIDNELAARYAWRHNRDHLPDPAMFAASVVTTRDPCMVAHLAAETALGLGPEGADLVRTYRRDVPRGRAVVNAPLGRPAWANRTVSWP